MRHPLTLLALAVLSLAGAAALRARIGERRLELGLVSEPPGDLPEILRPSSGSSDVAVLGATLGVFRPLALNFLWLRSRQLYRQGRFFESAALARGITTLQPRLPEVWAYQALSLAYDVSAEFPPGDRFRWIEAAVRLLRDRGLEYNPGSPRICEVLTILFLHKIGAEFDDAHWLYKEELAAAFEAPRDAGAGALEAWRASRLEEWRLDGELLSELARRYLRGDGPREELDLRSPFSHALYWTEVGLLYWTEVEFGSRSRSRYVRSRLGQWRIRALGALADLGLPLRQAGGSHYAYLPDLRLVDAVRIALEGELERSRGDALSFARATENLEHFSMMVTLYLALWDRRREAEEWRRRGPPGYRGRDGMERLLVDLLAPEGGVRERGAVLGFVCGLTRTHLHLSLEGSDVAGAAAGMLHLASVLHARWNGAGPDAALPPLDEIYRSLARDLMRRLRDGGDARRSDLATRLAEALPEGAAGGDAPRPEDLRLPTELSLPPILAPLRLEALDPFFRQEFDHTSLEDRGRR